MAHAITELTRSVAPSADYPNGDIADNPDGTLVNRMMLTDVLQLYQKLMIDAGITPNGLDDNTTNGYEYIDALDYRYDRPWTSTGVVFESIGLQAWTNIGAPFYNVGYSIRGNVVMLCGVASITGYSGGPGTLSGPVITLPAGARPASTVYVSAVTNVGGLEGTQIKIEATGLVSVSFGNSGNGTVFFDGVSFRIS